MESGTRRIALYQEQAETENSADLAVHCLLCPHGCVIRDGSSGHCRVRENHGGTLYAASYGHVSSLALDPVEKKPLARFHPGSFVLSAGSWGCNMSCRFCQNHAISQTGVPSGTYGPRAGERIMSPEDLVAAAVAAVSEGNIGIAYTYNEPLVGYEFVLDTARLAHEKGLLNVLVTNGYINAEPLGELLPHIDAMNIDLKAWTDGFYRKICGGTLDPVLASIAQCAPKCHVEVTTLVIPGLNSDPVEISALASWLASVSPDLTLHLTRHHPDYLMLEPAPISRSELMGLAAIAKRHLEWVYCGNI